MTRILLLNFLFGLYFSYRIYNTLFNKFKFYFAIPTIFVIAQLFFILKVISAFTGIYIPDWLMNISYILLGITVYLLIYFLLFDILWLFRIRYKPFSDNKLYVGITSILLSLATFAYGYYHHLDTKIKYYEITTNKPLKESLKIAVISDIHIGSGISAKRLGKYIKTINSLKPDMVLIVGDIIDSELRAFTEEYRSELRNLKAPMGVYAVLGNHEYYSGNINDVISAIKDANIKLLKNETVFFKDKELYLTGRDSIRHSASLGNERMSTVELMKQFDSSKPVILMDHIPKNIEDGKKMNVDLQVSGHTHGGQFFPITEIVKQIYPLAYGHLQDEDFNLIVTSGLGLWGPPIRIGSDSEIVIITIKGK